MIIFFFSVFLSIFFFTCLLSKIRSKFVSDTRLCVALTFDGNDPPSRWRADTLGPECFLFIFLLPPPYVWLEPDARYGKLLSNSELTGCAKFCNEPPWVKRSDTESRLWRRRL